MGKEPLYPHLTPSQCRSLENSARTAGQAIAYGEMHKGEVKYDKIIREVAGKILNSMPVNRKLTLKQVREVAGFNYNTPDKTLIRALEYLIESERGFMNIPATFKEPHYYMMMTYRS